MANPMDHLQLRLPEALEHEQQVLGSMMVAREPAVIAGRSLVAADFFRHSHRLIFMAILSLVEKDRPTDPLSVAQALGSKETVEKVGGAHYLMELVNSVPTASAVEHYAGIVKEKADRRAQMEVAEKLLADGADENREFGMGLIEAEESLRSIRERRLDRQRFAPTKLSELWGREFEPVRWVVDGLLPEGLMLLVGPPKRGKTILAGMIALAAACGGNALGTHTCDPCEVLYLALEDSDRRLQDRAHRILGGIQPEWEAMERFYYETKCPRFGDEGGLGEIERWLDGRPLCRLAVIDILGRIRPRRVSNAPLYDEDLEFLAPIQRLATQRRIAILGLHHTNKRATEDTFLSTSGTQGFGGTADGQMTLQSKRGESQATLEIEHREFLHAVSIELVFDRDLGIWAPDTGDRKSVGPSEPRRQILRCLIENGPLTPKRLAEKLQKNVSTTWGLLAKMEKDGQVGSNGGAYYALTTEEAV